MAANSSDTRGVTSPTDPAPSWRHSGGGDHYQLGEEIGEGGFGTVYRARQDHLDRDVAVKKVKGWSDRDMKQFHIECKALARLDHRNVIRVYDAWFDDIEGFGYIVMELAEGGSLDRRMPMTPGDAVRAIADAARAVEAFHREGIVHGDLKPQNLLMTADGTVKVSDLGIARLDPSMHSERWVTQRAAGGTPAYRAPELVSGSSPTEASDVYALGATLYALIEGREPFSGKGADLNQAILHDDPQPMGASVPAGLASRIMWSLTKQPEHRPTAAQLLVALEDPSLFRDVPTSRRFRRRRPARSLRRTPRVRSSKPRAQKPRLKTKVEAPTPTPPAATPKPKPKRKTEAAAPRPTTEAPKVTVIPPPPPRPINPRSGRLKSVVATAATLIAMLFVLGLLSPRRATGTDVSVNEASSPSLPQSNTIAPSTSITAAPTTTVAPSTTTTELPQTSTTFDAVPTSAGYLAGQSTTAALKDAVASFHATYGANAKVSSFIWVVKGNGCAEVDAEGVDPQRPGEAASFHRSSALTNGRCISQWEPYAREGPAPWAAQPSMAPSAVNWDAIGRIAENPDHTIDTALGSDYARYERGYPKLMAARVRLDVNQPGSTPSVVSVSLSRAEYVSNGAEAFDVTFDLNGKVEQVSENIDSVRRPMG
jgi:serine/threonine-protein kinase